MRIIYIGDSVDGAAVKLNNPDFLRDIDLNLLKIFDAVYLERNIGRASLRLNVSQPVVSGALTRLKILLNDQLFRRTPNGVEPTALTYRIAPLIHDTLSSMVDILQETRDFIPAESGRTFTINLSDSGELSFLPLLLKRFSVIAPSIELRSVRKPLLSLSAALESSEVHIALGTLPEMGPEFEREHLFNQDFVLVVGEHHQYHGEPLTREDLLQFEYVIVSGFPDLERLARDFGTTRNIRSRVSHYLSVPLILSTSNLAAWLPRPLVDQLSAFGKYREIPIAPDIRRMSSLSAVRHRRSMRDPGSNWFWGATIKLIADAY